MTILSKEFQEHLRTITGTEWVSFSYEAIHNSYMPSDYINLTIKVRDFDGFPAKVGNIDKLVAELDCLRMTKKSWHGNGNNCDRCYVFEIIVNLDPYEDNEFSRQISRFARKIADEEFAQAFEEET